MKKIIFLIIFLIFSVEIIANVISIETKHRRRYDEIHVEIWMKASPSYSPYISAAKFHLKYDTKSLIAIDKLENSTDSISINIDQDNPIIDIISPINAPKGLTPTQVISINDTLGEIIFGFTRVNDLIQGIKLDEQGMGTFVTKLKFKIKDSVNYNSICGIKWNIDSSLVYDDSNKDISENLSFGSDSSFKVVGIKLLTPILDNSVIDRDKKYLSLKGGYSGKGYPIFFERSIIPSKYRVPTIQNPQIDKNLAYTLEVRTGNGEWFDFGRFIESDVQSSTVLSNNLYYTGNISNPNTSSTYILTSQKGSKLTLDNYKLPVRVLINQELDYKIRYDQIYLRLRKLDGKFGTNLSNWSVDSITTNTYGPMTMGRIFFLYLNGKDQYLKTEENISNSTQLTVEAWVNMNIMKPDNSSPGIVVSSAGEEATPINGSNEGAWMLYLKNGEYPAFRVREINNRGRNGYLADLASDDPLSSVTIDSLYQHVYELNWNHIAATVNNNEVRLYVNGVIVDKFTNNSAVDTRMLVTNHPIWVGLNPNNKIEINNYFGGGIKAVRLWKVALTQEEIKKHANGLFEPANISQFDDIRRGLIFNYSFNGDLNDLANEPVYQHGSQIISYLEDSKPLKFSYLFKPDLPHIKLTAPISKSGLSNIENSTYEINWVAYEIGDIGKVNSRDVEIEFTLDGGVNWYPIKDSANKNQIGTTAPDVEKFIYWEPYLNNDANANLRSIEPYTKKVQLRLSGTVANLQKDAYYISDTITIAPFFSVYKGGNTIIKTNTENTINFIGNRNLLELWIKPYRYSNPSDEALPLLAKVDSLTGVEYFSLKLLSSGLLEFNILDSSDSTRTAISDINYPIIEANSIALDSPWTHIAVYFDMDMGNGKSFIRFYIDGTPQNDSSIVNQLGTSFKPMDSKNIPTYLCSYPFLQGIKIGIYEGEFRDFRFWKDLPTNLQYDNDLDDLTLFIQGALTNRTEKFNINIKKNLKFAISFNGGTGVKHEIKSFTSVDYPSFYFRYYNTPPLYIPTKPYIKFVEPLFRQRVNNKSERLRIRWIGFDYSSLDNDFSLGAPAKPPVIEYSLLGGGGNETQPYKYVGCPYWSGNTVVSLSVLSEDRYKFYGVNDSTIYALNLNVSQANPDKNMDGKYNDQGTLPATLTNARLRLTLKYRINNLTNKISCESSLFTITPGSNFTLRLIPEGYYDGKDYPLRQIGTSLDDGGIRIKIFEDNDGHIGKLVDSADSFFQFTDVNGKNLNSGNNRFANIDFVFENLNMNSYWVLAEHRNHLPVLSRFGAPYIFKGDNPDTWQIESGWDFTSWNGVKNNFLPVPNSNPWTGRYYTAYGNASSIIDDTAMINTSLIFSSGLYGDIGSGLSLMVAGDINQDLVIDENDYNTLRKSEGTFNSSNDLTGDKFVNADDRILVSKNMQRIIGFDTSKIPLEINFVDNRGEISSSKIKDVLLSSNSSARLYFDYEIKGKVLYVNISMEAIGVPFYLGSSTLAIIFDTTQLKYRAFSTTADVAYNKAINGYLPMRSAPELNNTDGIKNIRTIEIEYDKNSGKGGTLLGNEKTYIGSFRFDILLNKTLILNWHQSTSINSTDAKLKPNQVVKDSISPIYQYTINLLSPNGGEEYRPKTPIDIKWNFTGTSLINLEYSYNFGYNWIRINQSPVDVSAGKYSWAAPSTYSTTYLVRVIDYDSGRQVDISDSPFSVVSGFAYFLKPAANDEVYIGGTKSQIFWASGGLSSITLLFSSNSGDNWTVIGNKIDATKSEIMWTLPKTNTRTAVIRMVDNLTKDTIVDSDLFKILSGRIIFQRPNASENVYINREYAIRWTNEGVDTFDLQVSYDNGENWEYLKVNLPGRNQIYKWLVPNKESEFAVLRAIWKGDENLEFGMSNTFVIKTLNGISDDELSKLGISIYPNPFKDFIIIENSSEFEINELKIKDINGKELLKQRIKSNKEKFDLKALSSGIYFLELFTKEEILRIKLLKD